MRVVVYLVTLFLLIHCFAPTDPYENDSTTKKSLTSVAFIGNIPKTDSQFASYAKTAGRVSLIDPDQEKEAWAMQVSGFDLAVPLPDFNGVVLFSDKQVKVVIGANEQSFILSGPFVHTAAASAHPAYSLASLDGSIFETIRLVGDGEWQHQVFTTPWDQIPDTEAGPVPGQPVYLITMFNSQGTILFVFSPIDGRFTVLNAGNQASPFAKPETWCGGDDTGSAKDATFRSAVWDENKQLIFAGDKNGRIVAIAPFGSCVAVDSTFMQLQDADPIIGISILASGQLGITQDNGKLHIVDFDGSSFSVVETYHDICDLPIGAMSFSGSYILVSCMDQISGAPYYGLGNMHSRYVTLDTTTKESISSITMEVKKSAGAAVNLRRRTFYRIVDGAFGVLQRIGLLTGVKSEKNGIFLEGILDE